MFLLKKTLLKKNKLIKKLKINLNLKKIIKKYVNLKLLIVI